MATTYTYRVRDKEGRLLEGTLEADSTTLVANRLQSMGYMPVSIERAKSSKLQLDIKIPGLSDRIKGRDVAVFARQFATMINSGLALIRALHILGEQTDNKQLAQIVSEVRLDVERGSSLSQALGRFPEGLRQALRVHGPCR